PGGPVGRIQAMDGLIASIDAQLERMPQVLGSVSLLSSGSCEVRRLAHSTSDLTFAQTRLWAQARKVVLRLAPLMSESMRSILSAYQEWGRPHGPITE